MKDIIDGFLKFQREAYPKRAKLFKIWPHNKTPALCLSLAPIAVWSQSW